MKSNIIRRDNRPWSPWQKIAFRFFFIFLTLQILTENFLGNWFGRTLFIWRLGEKIFVAPCLWLNHHIFHFKYIPQTWTTFSGALHTIRDTVYLLLTVISCLLWTIFDRKNKNYNRLLYWFSQCLVVALSCILFAYGISKLFPVQMISPSFIGLHTPVGDLSPFDLLWTTFGYGTSYQVFTGCCELAAAILILFGRTRVIGLFIAASVMTNVIMLNYTYQVGVLVLSFYILLVALFLLAPYARSLSVFFFSKEPAILSFPGYAPSKNYKTIVFRVITLLLLGSSFTLNTLSAYNLYSNREITNHSRQYSLVRNYVVDNDTLKLVENDTLCWRIWSERVTNGKRFVTIAMMNPEVYKTYWLEQDSSAHSFLLHPSNQADTSSLHFTYTKLTDFNWRLDGVLRQKKIQVELQRINPDTTVKLLKTKHVIIPFDDESDSE